MAACYPLNDCIIQAFKLVNVFHIEDVIWVKVLSQQVEDTRLQYVAHANCIYLEVRVGCLEQSYFRWYFSARVGPSISEEHYLSLPVQEATVRGWKDVLSEALHHLSSICERSVVTSRLNAVGHLIDVIWIVIGSEADWAELQFNVTAECEHANCHVTTEEFGKVCKNV